MRWVTRRFVLGVAAGLVSAASAHAQTYPNKIIKMIVPAAAGGATDVLARTVADSMSGFLGKPIIIENRAGAGGALGAKAVAGADPDGYTIMFGNTAVLATIPATSRSAGYDPVASFAPVALVTESYQVLVVRADFPAKSVSELVKYAKANPDKINFGTGGPGNITHLAGELLKLKAGIDLVNIHYKSGGEYVPALLGGQVQMIIDNVSTVRGLIQDGKLRSLAVTSAARQADFPDVPTMIESGIPDYVVTSFFGVVAPVGTPQEIVARLNSAANDALKKPSVIESLARLGNKPAGGTPNDFRSVIVSQSRKWVETAKAGAISLD